MKLSPDNMGVSLQEHIYDIEEEEDVPQPVLFCLYPDLKNNEVVGWRVYAVQEKDQQFKSRLPLSEKLRALRDEVLGNAVVSDPLVGASEDLRPSDFIHCHATGFIAGTKSLVRPCSSAGSRTLFLSSRLEWEVWWRGPDGCS